MIGAIAGDIVGSIYEGREPPEPGFPLFQDASRFTDDTVLTIAIATAIRRRTDYATALREWGRRFPHAGYGGMFLDWLFDPAPAPYNSFGNGSAMRVAAIGWAFQEFDEVLVQAKQSAAVTHNHPEGIKGAQAIAAAVFKARLGASKDELRTLLSERFSYDCSASLAERRAQATFDVTCQGTVPAAAVAFFESHGFEDAVRNAVSLGGDTDTLACIAGAIAEAHYGGVPAPIRAEALERLDEPLKVEALAFARHYGVPL